MNKRIGSYQILQTLHVGTFGTTYLGARQFQNHLLRHVVLKKISPLNTTLAPEAAALIQLNHPHMVKIFDILKIHKDYWIVTDYVTGWNLDEFLKCLKEPTLTQPQHIFVILKILSELLDALIFLHQHHWVHGDIHPSNLRITPHLSVQLIDFGIAQKMLPTSKQRTLGLRPGWSSPEKIQTQQEDPSGDFYSFSVLVETIVNDFPMFTIHPDFIGLLNCAREAKAIDPDQRIALWMAQVQGLYHHRTDAEKLISIPDLQQWAQTLTPPCPLPTQKIDPKPLMPPHLSRGWFWPKIIFSLIVLGISPNGDHQLFRLAPSSTIVIIQAKPWAKIIVNQKPLGTTPLNVTLTAGSEPLIIEASHGSHTQTQEIRTTDVRPFSSPRVVYFDMNPSP